MRSLARTLARIFMTSPRSAAFSSSMSARAKRPLCAVAYAFQFQPLYLT